MLVVNLVNYYVKDYVREKVVGLIVVLYVNLLVGGNVNVLFENFVDKNVLKGLVIIFINVQLFLLNFVYVKQYLLFVKNVSAIGQI